MHVFPHALPTVQILEQIRAVGADTGVEVGYVGAKVGIGVHVSVGKSVAVRAVTTTGSVARWTDAAERRLNAMKMRPVMMIIFDRTIRRPPRVLDAGAEAAQLHYYGSVCAWLPGSSGLDLGASLNGVLTWRRGGMSMRLPPRTEAKVSICGRRSFPPSKV